MRTMALASECFKEQKDGRFRCEPSGPPVTAYDYVICRYSQQQLVSPTGTVDRSEGSKRSAKSAGAGLQQLLDRMFGQTASITRQPLPGQEGGVPVELSLPKVGVTSTGDAKKQYEQRFA